MIDLVEAGKLPKNNNYPTAFFNRACYYSELFRETGEQSYLDQALENLRAIETKADKPEVFRTHIENDPQLAPVRNHEDFKGFFEGFAVKRPN